MTERSLQATCRKGRTFAAYLHLSHPTGEKSARTVASADGLLIVDYNGADEASSGPHRQGVFERPRALREGPLSEQRRELANPSGRCPSRGQGFDYYS
jgi:hypothetical protein